MPKLIPPVKSGESIELMITGLSHTGDGVGKTEEGFTVFIPLALPGERVRVKIAQVKKTYAHARLEEIIASSDERVDAPCPVFETCGGCQIQHLTYAAQLTMKQQQVIDAFRRIGGLEHTKVLPPIGMDNPWNYRNKAQVPFGQRNGKTVAGFYAAGSHQIVEFSHCMIQQPENDRTIQWVKNRVKELQIPSYNEKNHRGILRHVMVRTGIHTNDVMVVLVTNGEHLPRKKELLSSLIEKIPGLTSVVQNINKRRSNVVLGNENRLLWGDPVIHDYIGDVRFAISPHSFFQVNPLQTERLYREVKNFASLSGKETVLDVYCGTGTIGLYLAKDAKRVLGIESIAQAVDNARENAMANDIHHASFTCGKAEEVLPRWEQEGIRAQVIVVDPPRKGCEERLLDACVEMNPERIVYVSCNPATLARDASRLEERGFQMRGVQPVDMFPHTNHIECVTVFDRMEDKG
ncbi:23S rRNA (uracil(1939)-C(5))-methyltransferase RlmD [Marininema halotolerans]|uniref:23S rRNA (Uracil1939-C5)-methyltransferase n=1 Tax=Marininema halotolerans TaxID=1155944 RepID=A0A1I6NR17_9BACL|nr:23S rRNA (uracil(1939)-C(5))-methyltransferase RlmD [Marininema halotolerans]SFS30452.1 23S rRNA (uracil1939-C5)-methyltransferase [Marininema halotolerans]